MSVAHARRSVAPASLALLVAACGAPTSPQPDAAPDAALLDAASPDAALLDAPALDGATPPDAPADVARDAVDAPPVNQGTMTVAAADAEAIHCVGAMQFYVVDHAGNLTAYTRGHPDVATPPWGSDPGTRLDTGWGAYSNVVASADGGLFYAVDAHGDVHWFRHREGTDATWAAGAGRVLAHGWDTLAQLTSDGDGVVYGLDAHGALVWHRHDDTIGGTINWSIHDATTIDTGWTAVRSIVASGAGVVYAVRTNGELVWHRYSDYLGGRGTWVAGSGNVVGTGWDRYAFVVSAGAGVLYAVDPTGDVFWYRHADPLHGHATWVAGSGARVGSGYVADVALADVGACTVDALGIPPIVHGALLTSGLWPAASDALRTLGITAARIEQTIGYASDSAGYHAPDGSVDGAQYTAAVDLSVSGQSDAQIRTLLEDLGRVGYAGFYRYPGRDGWPAGDPIHVHAVYAECPMKPELDGQITDYVAQRNGLVGDATYAFYTWSAQDKDIVLREWNRTNQ